MASGDEIKAARTARGLSQRALGDAVGCSQPAIKAIEDGTTIDSRYEEKARRFLGLKPKMSFDADPVVALTPPEGEIFGPRDLKLFAAAECGTGEMVVSNEPIEFLPRPWYLGQVEGYAVLIVGESMVPSFRPGQIAIINPRLPAMKGRDTLFRREGEDGTFVAMIKHLVKWTQTEWCVEQFNPQDGQERFFALDRKVWTPHRIVGRYDNG
jgi:phage repressor protein C with HTH and peptisase S24 domain